jgi:elongator complex protein 2
MGGKGLGLFGSLWARDKSASGMSVIASTWNGGFQRWQLEEEAQGDMVDGEWLPEIAVTGHQHAVKDIAWDPAQEYLLSVR